jgi:hypothetical protein
MNPDQALDGSDAMDDLGLATGATDPMRFNRALHRRRHGGGAGGGL